MIEFILEEGVDIPKYQTKGAVGFDVTAHSIVNAYKGETAVEKDKLEKIQKGFEERGFIKIRGFERILFNTGITVADMPEDLELQVRSRSGISLKKGLIVANQPGTIDPDYRSFIGIIIYNSTPFLSSIKRGERIAQIVPKQVTRPEINFVEKITETERGSGGFGSTN